MFMGAGLAFLSALMPMFYTSRDPSFYKKSGWRQRFYGGFFFKIWGAHRLLPGHRDYQRSLQTHIGIVRDGKSLIMFPDGKRLPEPEIGSIARGGVGYLAWKTGAVTVPVRITGAYRITLADFFLRRRRVGVIFGEPLSPEVVIGAAEPTVDACKKASKDVMGHIRELAPSP